MTPLEALKRIAKYTEENIAPLLNMRKEVRNSGDIMEKNPIEPEFVHPIVTYGTIPHKNFQPLDFQCPMILWTFDEVSDEGTYDESRIVSMRASVSAYTSELYNDDRTPDRRAFVDLTNALEKMYIEISKHRVLNGVGIRMPINYGIYDGAYYPYAYGYLTLTAEIPRVLFDEINIDEIC
ncbi:MAG: hypothetical protein ACI4RO_04040 [Candidatus Scatosoma sp.]